MSEISNNNEYIPRAERRNKDGLTEKEFLEQYNPGHYERPSVTVDMLLFGMSRDLKCLKVLLIKRNNHPYIDCYALPRGFVNITESAYTAACRELEEETGYTAKKWTSLGYIFTTPAICSEKLYLFFAQNLTPGIPHPDEGEFVEFFELEKEKVFEMIKNGEICDAKTICALMRAYKL